MSNEGLPPLPKPREWEGFGADQMQAYARAALAASPQAPVAYKYGDDVFIHSHDPHKMAMADPLYLSPQPQASPQAPVAEPFVVRHYTAEDRPTIKGNGFDGLEIGDDREEAEAFVRWINARTAAPQPQAAPQKPDIHSCSYYCDRPECIKMQRDELVKLMEQDGTDGRYAPTPQAPSATSDECWFVREDEDDNLQRADEANPRNQWPECFYVYKYPPAPSATSDDVRDKRIAELEEHLTQDNRTALEALTDSSSLLLAASSQCIATLKAENAEWKRIADQAHAALLGAVHLKFQAAAMAGLLEEALDMLGWPGCNDEAAALHHKIDAALAAWKGK